MFLSEDEEKEYYNRSEKEMRNIRHDSSKMHTPSIETSPAQPLPEKEGCPTRLFQLVLLTITFSSMIS